MHNNLNPVDPPAALHANETINNPAGLEDIPIVNDNNDNEPPDVPNDDEDDEPSEGLLTQLKKLTDNAGIMPPTTTSRTRQQSHDTGESLLTEATVTKKQRKYRK
jgi:hypothetical protein